MGDDTFAAGFITNSMKGPSDLNCTANDIDIAEAVVKTYRINNGPTVTLNAGDRIKCAPGDQVFVETFAKLQDNAQTRYDIGVWLAASDQNPVYTMKDGNVTVITNALTGSCTHYNLTTNSTGVSNQDGDVCGDMVSGGTTELKLDVLKVECKVDPNTNAVSIGACIGWQNSTDGAARVCTADQNQDAFRKKTTPETSSKCNCNPMILPIDVQSILRVKKVTVPSGDAQSFTFTPTSWNSGNTFSLTDGQTKSSDLLASGTYSVAETVPSDWTLTSVACVLTGTQTSFSSTSITNGVSVDLPTTGADVTCTFTNTKKAQLRIKKVTDPTGDAQSFTFTPSGYNGGNTFNLTDGQTNASGFLTPGTYGAAEAVPSGWALTNRACVLTGTQTAKTFSSVTNGVSVQLNAGDDVTCTFTNTKQAKLTIKKVTDPSGSSQAFTFTPGNWNGGTTFNLTDGQTKASGFLAPGTYTASEGAVQGWTLTNRACVLTGTQTAKTFSTISNGVSVQLNAGEDVTCTFTNTQGSQLRIKKVTVPSGDAQSFTFTPTGYNGGTTFNLTDGQTFDSGLLSAGTYSAAEGVPSGWALTNRACVLTGTQTAKTFSTISNGVSVQLGAGEDVTCTFTNTKQAQLRIKKVTVPSGDAQSFTFTPTGYNGGTTFNLTDGQTNASGFLAPATYSAAETVPSGWDLTNRACVLTGTQTAKTFSTISGGVSVQLNAGEDVTCTFTNTKRAKLTISKVTVPTGETQSFTFTPGNWNGGTTFNLTDGQSKASDLVTPGTYTASEGSVQGWVLTNRACVLTGTQTAKTFSTISGGVSVQLNAGEDVTCTFTNTKQAKVKVIKTLNGGAITGSEAFTFTLRTGASSTQTGTILETLVANSGNAGTLNFTTFLTPGSTYQICEVVFAGWHSSIESLAGQFTIQTEPDGDNSTICVPFTPTAGETRTFNIDNTPPPGGDARTIGFWKNWASCSGSNGKQKPVLDQTLTAAGGSILIGDLAVNTCQIAVAILNKSDIKTGKKMASDPGFNLAAQLLAARLNIVAGAGSCTDANTAIANGQALLDLVNFTGTGKTTMTAQQAAGANTIAGILDAYNNNQLCP